MAATSVPFDRIADRYDATRGGPDRGRQLAAPIAERLLPGRTLEVGVGTGLVAAELAGRGYDVVGVDLAPTMLTHAFRRLGARVAVGDALALPVATAAVSNVIFVAALHVIGDMTAALREAARVVRPGGRVVTVSGASDGRAPGDLAAAVADLPRGRTDSAEAVAGAAADAGLTELSAVPVRVGPLAVTPNGLAASLAGRAWSYLWDLDEDAWRERVEPAIAALRALPDPDRPRERALRFRLAVHERR